MPRYGNFTGGLLQGYLSANQDMRASDALAIAQDRNAREQREFDEKVAKDESLAEASQEKTQQADGYKVGQETFKTLEAANEVSQAATAARGDGESTPIEPVGAAWKRPDQAEIFKGASKLMADKGFGMSAASLNEEHTKQKKVQLLDRLSMGDMQGAIKMYNDNIPDGFKVHRIEANDGSMALVRAADNETDPSKVQMIGRFKDEMEATAYLTELVKGTPSNYLKIVKDGEYKNAALGGRLAMNANNNSTRLANAELRDGTTRDVAAGHDATRVQVAGMRGGRGGSGGGSGSGTGGAGGGGGGAGGFYAAPLGMKDQKGVDDFIDSTVGKMTESDLSFNDKDGKPVIIDRATMRSNLSASFEGIVSQNSGMQAGQAMKSAIDLERQKAAGTLVSSPEFDESLGKWVSAANLGGKTVRIGSVMSHDQAMASVKDPAMQKAITDKQDEFDLRQAKAYAAIAANPQLMQAYLSAKPGRSQKQFEEERGYYAARGEVVQEKNDLAASNAREGRGIPPPAGFKQAPSKQANKPAPARDGSTFTPTPEQAQQNRRAASEKLGSVVDYLKQNGELSAGW